MASHGQEKIVVAIAVVAVCGSILFGKPTNYHNSDVTSLASTNTEYEKAKRAFYQKATAETRERMRLVLEPRAVRIDFRQCCNTNGNVTKTNYSLWASGGDIFLRGSGNEFVNLVSRSGTIYRWANGERRGDIMKCCYEEVLQFVRYQLDPSWMMEHYYSEVGTCGRARCGKEKVVEWSDGDGRPGRFVFVYAEKPLWFFRREISGGGASFVLEISKPKQVEEITDSAKTLPKNVTFVPSSETLYGFFDFP